MVSWEPIAQQISQVTGRPFMARTVREQGTTGVNPVTVLTDDDRSYFVKHNRPDHLEMFRAEALGLHEIANTLTVQVPRPICWGATEQISYLIFDYLELAARTEALDAELGHALALLHERHSPYFGWYRDNTIGTNPQLNAPHADWATFWRDRRLRFQLQLAAANGYQGRIQELGQRVAEAVPQLLTDHVPKPSLLHGDLWAGNCAAYDRRPIVFDPAVYYGDREADLAMTELFGGFSPSFYAAYRDVAPLEPGYSVRKTLYNLYHVLNHLNLVGGGYLHQAERMMTALLAEIGV